MRSRKQEMLFWIAIIGSMILGALLGGFFLGGGKSENGTIVIGITIGALIAFGVYLLRSRQLKKRNGNIPNTDERSIVLMQRYLITVLYILLFGSQATFLILYYTGVLVIDTGVLLVSTLGIFIVIGIGALITRRF